VAAGASALADPESESDPSEDAAFFAFFAGLALLSSLPESESDEAAFLAAFLGAGLADSELSESLDDAAFLAAFLGAGLASEESESDDELSTFYFFGAAFLPLLPALAALLALTLEAALTLLAMTGLASEESESESLSLLLSCFLDFFLVSFLAAAAAAAAASFLAASFLALFLESSRLCFLDGGSDELALATCFFCYRIKD
jgi:hypothetical protein